MLVIDTLYMSTQTLFHPWKIVTPSPFKYSISVLLSKEVVPPRTTTAQGLPCGVITLFCFNQVFSCENSLMRCVTQIKLRGTLLLKGVRDLTTGNLPQGLLMKDNGDNIDTMLETLCAGKQTPIHCCLSKLKMAAILCQGAYYRAHMVTQVVRGMYGQ